MDKNLIFHQLFEKETSTYTYLLGDAVSREAIFIDPVLEMVERDFQLLKELNLNLKIILDTHVHADHITGSGELRKRTGAKIGVSSAYDMACPDLHIEDGQEISFGKFKIKALNTPGHTSGCLSFKLGNMVFTGDALLVRGCGRTDFQEGSSEKLFQSVNEKLFTLPEDTIVYPGHDYKGFTSTSIGVEKALNPRLNTNISKDKFIEIMASLKLAHPKKIQEAVPANLICGLPNNQRLINSGQTNGIATVSPVEVFSKLGQAKIIDVRGLDEFNNELGHIPNAELSPLGPKLDETLKHSHKSEEIIFVCRSGKGSGEAVLMALSLGFEKVYSMEGGMLKWNELRFPFERDMGGS